MIKSAAIVKTKTLAPWRELRLQKRKAKKGSSRRAQGQLKSITSIPDEQQRVAVVQVMWSIEGGQPTDP
jgi:hypothetical protein